MKILSLFLLIFIVLADELWAKNGMVLNIDAGDFQEVKVSSNPTTGYRWSADVIDSSFFSVVYTGYHSVKKNIPLTGLGGYETFKIQASDDCYNGEASVTLKYKRSWENDPVQVIKLGLKC